MLKFNIRKIYYVEIQHKKICTVEIQHKKKIICWNSTQEKNHMLKFNIRKKSYVEFQHKKKLICWNSTYDTYACSPVFREYVETTHTTCYALMGLSQILWGLFVFFLRNAAFFVGRSHILWDRLSKFLITFFGGT